MPQFPVARQAISRRDESCAAALQWRSRTAYTRRKSPGENLKTAVWLCGLLALGATTVSAQDLTITNARIVDGTGRVIERGSIVIRGGMIESVAAGAPSATAGRASRCRRQDRDAGLHRRAPPSRHGRRGTWLADTAPQAAARLPRRRLHDRAVRDRSAADHRSETPHRSAARCKGPRLFTGTFMPVAGATGPQAPGDPARTDFARGPRNGPAAPAIPREATIQQVQAAKSAGYDYLKVVLIVTPSGPEVDTLKLIVAEGKKVGMPTIVHAVSVIDTLSALDAQPDVLVHTPHIGSLAEDPYAIRKIVEAKIPMTSTLSVFGPHFGPDNTAAVPRRRAVSLEHAVERRTRTDQRAPAVERRARELRLRHRHAVAAEGDAAR